MEKLWRWFGADELAVLLWGGCDVAAGGDECVAVEDDEGCARAVDDVGYVGEAECGVGREVAVVEGAEYVDV